jgi:hypothetical protein
MGGGDDEVRGGEVVLEALDGGRVWGGARDVDSFGFRWRPLAPSGRGRAVEVWKLERPPSGPDRRLLLRSRRGRALAGLGGPADALLGGGRRRIPHRYAAADDTRQPSITLCPLLKQVTSSTPVCLSKYRIKDSLGGGSPTVLVYGPDPG